MLRFHGQYFRLFIDFHIIRVNEKWFYLPLKETIVTTPMILSTILLHHTSGLQVEILNFRNHRLNLKCVTAFPDFKNPWKHAKEKNII